MPPELKTYVNKNHGSVFHGDPQWLKPLNRGSPGQETTPPPTLSPTSPCSCSHMRQLGKRGPGLVALFLDIPRGSGAHYLEKTCEPIPKWDHQKGTITWRGFGAASIHSDTKQDCVGHLQGPTTRWSSFAEEHRPMLWRPRHRFGTLWYKIWEFKRLKTNSLNQKSTIDRPLGCCP